MILGIFSNLDLKKKQLLILSVDFSTNNNNTTIEVDN